MSGTEDKITGKGKEALGVLTDDKDLEREGKTDQIAGESKDTLDEAADWAKDKIDAVKDRVNRD
jgi:uncharacterized protein YjbJ (UPF0337 family)